MSKKYRDDFAVFILTHGRADNIKTIPTLKKCGYTGKIYLIVDDLDKTVNDYIAEYGDIVQVFDKRAVAATTDKGDNFDNLVTITHARNACWEIAKKVGVKYFIQLDDDYTIFQWRFDYQLIYNYSVVRKFDNVIDSLLDFYVKSGFLAVAMLQGGDFIGGAGNDLAQKIRLKRKAMNSFICSIDRPFKFIGTMNEDVNTYTRLATTGGLFGSVNQISLGQTATQSSEGGITETYLKYGTYVKAFTTVMFHPSGVKVRPLINRGRSRIHHIINYKYTCPKILREDLRKGGR